MMTPAAADKAPPGRPFQRQWEMSCTLWSDQQTEELAAAIRSDLESEIGPLAESDPEPPLQCAVGWRSEQGHNRGSRRHEETALDILSVRGFDGLRVCHCRCCGQRIAWKPAHGERICGKRCAERAQEHERGAARRRITIGQRAVQRAKERERVRRKEQAEADAKAARERASKPWGQIFFLKPDPAEIARIVDSITLQLEERHNIQSHFVGSTLVSNRWHVLEFNVVNGNGGSIHVILNGGGPGRASWVLGVPSAHEAVMKAVRYSA